LVPIAVGVPEISPPFVNVRPAGRVPEMSDQLYGPVPPVAASVWLYVMDCVPPGSEVVLTDSAEVVTALYLKTTSTQKFEEL
jgi:hypothetical protein